MTATAPRTRELDHRVSDGIDVRLLWREDDDRVFVEVADAKTGECFSFEVRDSTRVQHAFQHPFAYAPSAAGAGRRPASDDGAGGQAQLASS
jgi:hypothetical protein